MSVVSNLDQQSVTGAVLANGPYYVLYTAPNDPTTISGFIQGNGTSRNGSFTSSNGVNLNFDGFGTIPVTVSASYRAKASLAGTVSASGQTSSFSTTYLNEYELTPSLATIAGTYSGFVQDASGYDGSTLNVGVNGVLTGSTVSGCDVSGTIEPAAKGNAYAIGVTFSGVGCAANGLSVGGAAFFDAEYQFDYCRRF